VGQRFGPMLARLGEQETIWAAARVLRCWIETYGVPLGLYVDWKKVYVQEPTEKQRLRGRTGSRSLDGSVPI